MHPSEAHHRRRAFTTIELLVVIGIIVALIGILIPVVGKVRESAKATDTAAWIQQLSGAIESYHTDFRAYPGPLTNDEIRNNAYAMITFAAAPGFANSTGTNGRNKITMSENLVLGLLGGLEVDNTGIIQYNPAIVGAGPRSLNPGNPKRYEPYVEPKQLSWQDIGSGNARVKTGAFFDDATIGSNPGDPEGADDSIIPEFVDRYGDALPILYLRAKVGSQRNPMSTNKSDNAVITNDAVVGTEFRVGQYDISQIIGYTKTNPAIGVGRKAPPIYYDSGAVQNAPQWVHGLVNVNGAATLGSPQTPGYTYPYDCFPYFRDPALSNAQAPTGTGHPGPHVARQKDRFILISAGPDRVYGTSDDITNFGPVSP